MIIIRKLSIFFLSVFLLINSVTVVQADWIDDWFQQYTSSGPNYYETQKRGYVTFGSFSGRVPVTGPTHIFSISPPRIRGGCGGIDLFLGSFSFVNPEYLVQKLQTLIQAAPVVAFQIALKTLSSSLSEVVEWAQGAIDFLNQLQFDECKFLTPLMNMDFKEAISLLEKGANIAHSVLKGDFSLFTSSKKEKEGQTSQNVSQEGATRRQSGDACPSIFHTIYDNYGSVLSYVGGVLGLGDNQYFDSEYMMIMRAIVGDSIKTDQGIVFVSPKITEKDIDVNRLVLVNRRGIETQRELDFTSKVYMALIQAYQAKRNKESMSSSSNYFTYARISPLPLEHLVNVAALTNSPDILHDIAEGVSCGILISLLRHITAEAIKVLATIPPVSGDFQICPETNILRSHIEAMYRNAWNFANHLLKKYMVHLDEITKTYLFALDVMSYTDMVYSKISQTFGPSVANRVIFTLR